MKNLPKNLAVLILIFVFCIVGIFAEGNKESESMENTYEFKYANQQPENHSRTKSMQFLKEELEKRSNGRIKVEIYHSGVLGTEKEMFEMCVTGAIQGFRGAFYENLNTQFLIYNLPFLFQNYEEMIHFNASEMATKMRENGSVKGIYIPAVGFTGFRSMINNTRLVKIPADLKGIKVRSPGQAPILSFYKLFDASPQEMAWSEVYMAMKQGALDGADNSPSNIEAAKMSEVAKYYSALNYMAGADPFMVNMAWYESLPADLQKIFNEVSREAMAYWDNLEKDATQQAVKNVREAPGVVDSIDMSEHPELAAQWEKASAPLWEEFVDAGYFSWDDIKQAQAIIAEVRK